MGLNIIKARLEINNRTDGRVIVFVLDQIYYDYAML